MPKHIFINQLYLNINDLDTFNVGFYSKVERFNSTRIILCKLHERYYFNMVF